MLNLMWKNDHGLSCVGILKAKTLELYANGSVLPSPAMDVIQSFHLSFILPSVAHGELSRKSCSWRPTMRQLHYIVQIFMSMPSSTVLESQHLHEASYQHQCCLRWNHRALTVLLVIFARAI
jgi:hypothetical protein